MNLRFGIIGLGLMGREFASAAARWFHLEDMGVTPVITGICDTNPQARAWFEQHVPTIQTSTDDYRNLLARDDVDAIYCAVPHHLHQQLYTDIIRAGKHLLGEKPFGIDKEANEAISSTIRDHPDLTVACSSEFPFFPGALEVFRTAREGVGRVLEVEAGFLHSSDLNPDKPINWKRQIATNGAYGCMGDLGMHVVHLPLRLGWTPRKVRAQLSNIVTERPERAGAEERVPCETWDNATLLTEVERDGYTFPMTLHTKRIAPGEMNTWFIKVHGTERSVEFSTKFPKTLRRLEYPTESRSSAQAWQHLDLGYESAYPAITGGIFEFGFSDALLQMFAAFCDEVAHGREGMKGPLHCVTPEEAAQSHRIFTGALEAHGRSNG